MAELGDAPPLLFVAGDPSILEKPQLAMVGSRRASRPALDTAAAFSRCLAGAGFVITSGLAVGIDGAAHEAALGIGGQTVGVLGTGLQKLYPQRHRALAEAMIASGSAVVSEFPLDAGPQPANFPRRNRIISGLSLGVLVVEASVASGSLITARLAAEQGREVYAIPGSIHHPGSRGCHQLIRDGATLVETVEHILEGLRGWRSMPVSTAELFTPSCHPLVQLLQAAPHTSEALVSASGWDLPRLLAALTELELEGHVVLEGGALVCSRQLSTLRTAHIRRHSMISTWRVQQAARAIRAGAVIAYPTEAVWGLGCDPWDEEAVERLLAIKSRPVDKGLILVADNIHQFDFLFEDFPQTWLDRMASTWPGPEYLAGTASRLVAAMDHRCS